MPTSGRRRFVPLAVEYWRRQDYPESELIVVGDAGAPIADLLPRDERVRFVEVPAGTTVGARRNVACEHARGRLIAHWDDDDWYAPDRLRRQVAALRRTGAPLCGVPSMFFYDLRAGRAWRYDHPPHGSPWLSALCYERSFWEAHRFADQNVGEDALFLWGGDAARYAVLPDLDLQVCMLHGENVAPKKTRSPAWTPVPVAEVAALLGDDWRRYARSGAARATAGHNGVTVSIPYHRCRPHIRRAVESILAQTHRDLRVVVVNDGDPAPPWDELAHLDDPRLVRFELPENRGRYFADAVVLGATDDPYLVVQDADDWSEPERIARLLRAVRLEHAAGAVSAAWRHRWGRGEPVRETPRALEPPLAPELRHRAEHHGLFRTDALRAVGGYFGGFRVGYDTLLINFLLMTGRLAYVDEPLYHHVIRPDSLTSARETGMRSELRREATARLRALFEAAHRVYQRYLDGEADRPALLEAIREAAGRWVTPEDRRALARETARLRAMLEAAGGVEALPVRAAPASEDAPPALAPEATVGVGNPETAGAEPAGAGDLETLLAAPAIDWGDWAINRPLARALVGALEAAGARRILDVGSGVSTAVLAWYAARHGARVTSLEHAPAFAARTRAMLDALELVEPVELIVAPLGARACPDGRRHPWYDAVLGGPFDFVLVDGPPGQHGREAAFFAVYPHLAERWELWLHDGARAHEAACVDLWGRHFDFERSLETDLDPRGVWRLRGRRDAAGGLGVGLLTGGRPALLAGTVEALRRAAPGLLERAHVVALVNGPDPATRAYVDGLDFVDRRLDHAGPTLPIGEATSRVMAAVAAAPGVRHVLHLEDDWAAGDDDPGWLERARALLDARPEVGQVRLRHAGERVLPYHMVTRRPIRWEPADGCRLSPAAHFTFNPSLIRAADVPRLFPCSGEAEAQRRFLAADFATAQLVPGVFRHLGETHSLRRALNR